MVREVSASTSAKGVSRAARREVFERDGEQCTFVDEHGHRCTATGFLEIDHKHARGRGGSDDAKNLRVLCRAHNLWPAKKEYGHEHVEEQIHLRQQTSTWKTAAVALENLGFRASEVKKAIGDLEERHRDGELASRISFAKESFSSRRPLQGMRVASAKAQRVVASWQLMRKLRVT